MNNAPDVDNQGQTAISSIPSDHKPVPGTSDSANQGQTVMSFISSGHNSVLKTADAASQREAAMPCEMTQVPTPLTQETSATDISKRKNNTKSQRHHPYKTHSNGKHQLNKDNAAKQQLMCVKPMNEEWKKLPLHIQKRTSRREKQEINKKSKCN